jgi:sodium-coupled neutral amino acid transporter 9
LLIGREQEKMFHITGVNMVVISICITFACFYPSIGTIIRFSGAICGFVIIFLLPCLVHLQSRRKQGTLTPLTSVLHISIILVGFANVIAQFSFF